MREVIIPFQSHVADEDEVPYRVRIIGVERADGTWEGRIEFTGGDYSGPVTTGVESTRSSRVELEQWATGLKRLYLEGALRRACWRAARHASKRAESRLALDDSRA